MNGGKRDWSLYNLAQTQEKILAAKMLNDAVDSLELPYYYCGNGRPGMYMGDMIKACVMKVFNCFSSRRSIPDMQILNAVGCLHETPHFNTINKFLSDTNMTPHLERLYKILAKPLAGIEFNFAIDATGFGTQRKIWAEYRTKAKRILDFKKLSIVTGTKTNIITSVKVSDGNIHDIVFFQELVRGTARNFKIREVYADKAYISRENCKLVKDLGGFPYIMPKCGQIRHTPEYVGWYEMIKLFEENEELFREHYSKRSNVESTFSAMKRKFLPYIRTKRKEAQKNELLCKVVCQNLSVLVNAIFELGVSVKFKST